MTRKIKIEPIIIIKEEIVEPTPKPKRASRKKVEIMPEISLPSLIEEEPIELMPEVVKTEPEISPSLSDEETYKTFVQQVELKPVELKPIIEPVIEPVELKPVIEPVLKNKKEGEKATCPICNKTMLLKTLKYYHSLKCKPPATAPPQLTEQSKQIQPLPEPQPVIQMEPPKMRVNPASERAAQRKERLNSLIMNSLKR